MAPDVPDLEQAGELKFGQVGIANLRIRRMETDKLCTEMRDRIQRAPKLFAGAAVVLDFGGLGVCPDADAVRTLVESLRRAGVLPVAIAYGTSAIEALSVEVGLPLLAKFRASYERPEALGPVATCSNPAGTPKNETEAAASDPLSSATPHTPPPPAAKSEPGLVHLHPVRSGQQVYAQHRDLTICGAVGAGAEVIADGSIHVYGALRGRALAGVGGLAHARIFCRDFNAELVAIAGTYKVLEEVPKTLLGKPVQIWLEHDQIRIEEMA